MAARRGNVHVVITGDASGLDRATKGGERSLAKMKKAMAVSVVGAAAGVTAMVNTAADFEQQMSALGSVTDANAKQMAAFRAQALDAGAATKYSASEAAAAQTELAKGGLSVANIMRGGLNSALALAAAGEMELADAAATTANAMNLFGLSGSRSMKVADALATAANATTGDVADFAIALTQGGGAAKSAGLTFEQTIVALEALAQSGVKGSDAGTSLKNAMMQLAAPTKQSIELQDELGLKFFDAEGRMRPLVDISAMLRDRFSEMGEQQRLATLKTLAGGDGFRALLALYDQGPKRLDRLARGVTRSGTAAEVAARQQDNLRGRLEALGGSIETVSILAGSVLIPPLTEAATVTADFIGGLASGQGAGGQFAATIRTVASDVAGVATEVAGVGWTFVQVGAQVAQSFVPVVTAIGTVGRDVAQTFTPLVITVGQATAVIAQFGYGIMQTRGGLIALTALVGALTGRMVALGVAWGVSRIMGFVSAIRTVIATMGVLRAVYIAQTGITNASTLAILRHAAASRTAAGASRALALAFTSTGFGAALVVVGTLAGALLGMKSSTDRAKTSAKELNDALREQADAMRAVRDIDIDVAQRKATLRSANVAVEQAQARVNALVREGKRGTLEYRAAMADLAQAKVQQRRATRDLADAEADNKRKREDLAEATTRVRDRARGRIQTLEREAESLAKVARNERRLADLAARGSPWRPEGNPEQAAEHGARAAEAAEQLARKQLQLARETKKVDDAQAKLKEIQIQQARASGASRERVRELKDELSRLRDRSDKSADRVRRLRREIAELTGKRVRVDVDLNLLMPGARGAAGDLRGDGWGLTRAVRRGAQAKANANPMAFFAAMGGGLGNADAGAVDAFTPYASRFGLAVSSGFRPGSITSSGNVSLHALNRARDYAGSPAAMLAFARFMAARFGARLSELIYTPLGFSIRHGRRVAPYAQADHYDHVHVGFRAGGLVPSMLSPGELGVLPNGRTFVVPGRPVAADTVPMNLPVGTAVLTGDGQRRMLAGASLGEALRRQAPHFRKGGVVTTGYTVYDDPPPGAYGGGAKGLNDGYAELGTAVGNRATGVGNFARQVGMRGELPENFPLTITINGKTKRLRKRDRGFGQKGDGKGGGGSDSRFTIDIWRDSWSHFGLGPMSRGRARVAFGGAGGRDRSFTRIRAPKITHPLLGDMLAPLVDDALMGGIEAGIERTGRRPLLRQVLEGIVPESDDRATREKVSIPAGQVGKRIERMVRRGDAISAKKLKYQYGGYGNPSYDCSGLVSAILNAGGLLKGRLDTTAFKSWGKPGRGKLVTLGIRGGSGRSGHMMMRVGNRYYEASSRGVGRRSGWSGSFDVWRRPAWRQGGVVGPNGQRMLPPSPEGRAHLEKLAAQRGVSIETLLDPRSREWVGNGLRAGGVVLRFQNGIEPEAWGQVVGRTEVVRRGRRRRLTLRDLIRLLGGSPGTERADRLTRQIARDAPGADFAALLARQRQARRQIREMARAGFTGEERIKTRRLRGAISLVQDEMGRRIGRPIGKSDRAQERISRAQARFDDELIVDDIDPDSAEGRRRRDEAAAGQIATLRRRRTGLQRALRLARRTRNRAAIERAQGEINEVNDQILGLRSGRVQARPTARDHASAALAQAELSGDRGAQVAALRTLEDLARREYEQALKSGDPREIAEAAGELKQATEALKAATPTERDFADMSLALAELTEGTQDDVAALTTLRDIAAQQLQAALASGDPREIAEAARNLKGAADALKAATPTPRDWGDAALATAKLTETLDDDVAATEQLLALAEEELARAQAANDPRAITEAANAVLSLRDSLRGLREELTRSNELAQQRLDLDRQLAEQNARFLALGERQGPLILASLIELMNDGVGSQAKLAGRTPAVAGVPAAYR